MILEEATLIIVGSQVAKASKKKKKVVRSQNSSFEKFDVGGKSLCA